MEYLKGFLPHQFIVRYIMVPNVDTSEHIEEYYVLYSQPEHMRVIFVYIDMDTRKM